MQETFFIDRPVATGGTIKGGVGDAYEFAAYRTADGRLLRWSGGLALPEIGQRIYITMNGIGWGVVKGYFESDGYLGVMTKATKPPKWLREQRKRYAADESKPAWYHEGIGCEFGTEIALSKPKARRTA